MKIIFEENVPEQTALEIRAEIELWPTALVEELGRNNIEVYVGHNYKSTMQLANLEMDPDLVATPIGQYCIGDRKTILPLHDDEDVPYSMAYLKSTLAHEIGHAVAFDLIDKFPESSLYKNLYFMDHNRLFRENNAGYNGLDAAFKTATQTHSYPASTLHESFAEIFGACLSPQSADNNLTSWETTPCQFAVIEHILGNYDAGRPALENIDDFDIGFKNGPAITSKNGIMRPGNSTTIIGHSLKSLNDIMKDGEAGHSVKASKVRDIFERNI